MTEGRVRAFIGLGSNLENPVAQLSRALQAVARLPESVLLGSSSFYRNPPLGPADQPDFVNAVAGIDTGVAPLALLDELQAIERAQGRVRAARRWGPRTLDLDLLLFGELRLHGARLTLPHPRLHERAFVLYPLLELAPGLDIPGQGPIERLIERVPRGCLVRIEGTSASTGCVAQSGRD